MLAAKCQSDHDLACLSAAAAAVAAKGCSRRRAGLQYSPCQLPPATTTITVAGSPQPAAGYHECWLPAGRYIHIGNCKTAYCYDELRRHLHRASAHDQCACHSTIRCFVLTSFKTGQGSEMRHLHFHHETSSRCQIKIQVTSHLLQWLYTSTLVIVRHNLFHPTHVASIRCHQSFAIVEDLQTLGLLCFLISSTGVLSTYALLDLIILVHSSIICSKYSLECEMSPLC